MAWICQYIDRLLLDAITHPCPNFKRGGSKTTCEVGQERMSTIENNVCTRATNCFRAHETVILVFISRLAKQ